MSKIGKIPVDIPGNAKVKIEGLVVYVEGPKGKLSLSVDEHVHLRHEGEKIFIERSSEEKFARSIHGTMRSLLYNMVRGVTQGYKKELEIVGVGYKAQMKGKMLVLQIGFSHPVELSVPEGITVTTPTPTRLVVEGIDKQRVGEYAARIRRLYPPEPYKGKGIRYLHEVVRKKLGKAMAK